MSAAPDQDRLEALDGIRGFGMVCVVITHSTQAIALSTGIRSWRVPLERPLDDFAWSVMRYSWTGVDIFFVISGFLITGILVRSLGDPHYFRNFYARRILRIFPLYYLIILFRLYVMPMEPGGYSGLQQLAQIFYLSNIWFAVSQGGADPVLGVTWSLSIEEHFYLCWPLLVYSLGRRGLLRLCFGIVVGAFLLRLSLVWGGVPARFIWLFTLCRIDTMATGAIVALLGTEGIRRLWPWVVLSIAGQAFAILADDTTAMGPRMQTLGFTASALWGGCLVVMAVRRGFVARLFSWAPICFYGRHCYAIYLTHHLLINLLVVTFVDQAPGGVLQRLAEHTGMLLPSVLLFCLASVPLAFLIGWLLWHAVEQPFLKLRRYFVVRVRVRVPGT